MDAEEHGGVDSGRKRRGGGGRWGLAVLRAAAVGAACAVLTGCGVSSWERTFEANDGLVGTGVMPLAEEPPAGTVPFVDLRRVPWERMELALEGANARSAEGRIHPEEWPAERLGAARAALLEALQVSEPPAQVEILGRNLFTTTDPVRPDDGQLAEFARRVGANRVVWASRYIGKSERVEREPVTTFNSGSVWYRRDGKWRRGSFNDTSTTYVPVVVDADEFAFAVYYLRINR